MSISLCFQAIRTGQLWGAEWRRPLWTGQNQGLHPLLQQLPVRTRYWAGMERYDLIWIGCKLNKSFLQSSQTKTCHLNSALAFTVTLRWTGMLSMRQTPVTKLMFTFLKVSNQSVGGELSK